MWVEVRPNCEEWQELHRVWERHTIRSKLRPSGRLVEQLQPMLGDDAGPPHLELAHQAQILHHASPALLHLLLQPLELALLVRPHHRGPGRNRTSKTHNCRAPQRCLWWSCEADGRNRGVTQWVEDSRPKFHKLRDTPSRSDVTRNARSDESDPNPKRWCLPPKEHLAKSSSREGETDIWMVSRWYHGILDWLPWSNVVDIMAQWIDTMVCWVGTMVCWVGTMVHWVGTMVQWADAIMILIFYLGACFVEWMWVVCWLR
jgi:hypothetical protein